MDDSNKDSQMRITVKKTIDLIVSETINHFREQVMQIKEQYSQKLIEEQQKILDRYSAVINKIIQ